MARQPGPDKPARHTRTSSKGPKVTKDKRGVSRTEVTVEGRMAQFMAGEIKVEDLDNEELAKGQIRDKNGRFTGRPPSMVPKEFHDAAMRELLRRGEALLKENYLGALGAMTAIATGPHFEAKDRIRAAQVVIERIAGKTPDRVELRAEVKKWEGDIAGIIAGDPDEED